MLCKLRYISSYISHRRVTEKTTKEVNKLIMKWDYRGLNMDIRTISNILFNHYHSTLILSSGTTLICTVEYLVKHHLTCHLLASMSTSLIGVKRLNE